MRRVAPVLTATLAVDPREEPAELLRFNTPPVTVVAPE
jgi:hypothetical protein